MLSDEEAAASPHAAPPGKEGREGASDYPGWTSAFRELQEGEWLLAT